MRLIDADALRPDVRTKDGTLCFSKSRIANAPTIEAEMKQNCPKCNNCIHESVCHYWVFETYPSDFYENCTQYQEEREALEPAIKALKIVSTVSEAKFHDMSDSPMLQYKKGWNDALDAVKIKFESEGEYEENSSVH